MFHLILSRFTPPTEPNRPLSPGSWNTSRFFRPCLEGLEERIVLSTTALPGEYIVALQPGVSAHALASELQASGREVFEVYTRAFHGLAFRGEALPPDPRIRFIENNHDTEPTPQGDISLATEGSGTGGGQSSTQIVPTGVRRIQADQSPIAKIDGVDERIDVDVAIIDTGIDADHPDLNVYQGANFTTTDRSAWDDDNGHGTHVAGTVAALDNSFGVVGVAPGARLWAIKVFNARGGGSLAHVIRGIDYVTEHADEIEVANLSVNAVSTSQAWREAIRNSVAQGVVYVAAAGNGRADVYGSDHILGTTGDTSPASFPEVLTVSAFVDTDGQPGGLGSPAGTGADDTFAGLSNFSHAVVEDNPVDSPGQAIDLLMPGVSIYSTRAGGGYINNTGTSMAAPHATGLVALYISIHGRAHNADEVYAIRQALIDAGIEQTDALGLVDQNDPDGFRERIGWAPNLVVEPKEPAPSENEPEDEGETPTPAASSPPVDPDSVASDPPSPPASEEPDPPPPSSPVPEESDPVEPPSSPIPEEPDPLPPPPFPVPEESDSSSPSPPPLPEESDPADPPSSPAPEEPDSPPPLSLPVPEESDPVVPPSSPVVEEPAPPPPSSSPIPQEPDLPPSNPVPEESDAVEPPPSPVPEEPDSTPPTSPPASADPVPVESAPVEPPSSPPSEELGSPPASPVPAEPVPLPPPHLSLVPAESAFPSSLRVSSAPGTPEPDLVEPTPDESLVPPLSDSPVPVVSPVLSPAPQWVDGIGAFDPITATWYLRSGVGQGSANAGIFQFGLPGWEPLTGDWNGDGVTDIGVFDPATASWFLRYGASPGFPDAGVFQYGLAGWTPITGDWNGDGATDIGVVDPFSGTWYLRHGASGGAANAGIFQYGLFSWKPVTGDWNGDGRTDIGMYDPSTSSWYLRHGTGSGLPDAGVVTFGLPGWTPTVGDWDGDGRSAIGVIDTLFGTWHLRNGGGIGEFTLSSFSFGLGVWVPLRGGS